MKILPASSSAALARALTLSRLAALPLFLTLLVRAGGGAPHPWGMWLIVLYLFTVASDALDGPLARRGGAATPFWGRLDAGSDVAFNTLSLSAAAWLGWVGPWVPAGVALLGARFLWRAWRAPAGAGAGLPEDGPGKAAGVLFYLLVGGVVLELAAPGTLGRWALARAGDILFAMSLVLVLPWRRRAA